MAELADARDLKSLGFIAVRVQSSFRVPLESKDFCCISKSPFPVFNLLLSLLCPYLGVRSPRTKVSLIGLPSLSQWTTTSPFTLPAPLPFKKSHQLSNCPLPEPAGPPGVLFGRGQDTGVGYPSVMILKTAKRKNPCAGVSTSRVNLSDGLASHLMNTKARNTSPKCGLPDHQKPIEGVAA